MDQATDATATHFGATRTASVNGTNLAYREVGMGEPVVFVHGALSDLRSWEHQLPGVGRSYRAIAYSRRYHRPNEAIGPDAEDPWPAHVDDLVGFLREINAAPAHLVGNSQGAFISLLAAIQHPGLVRTLVIEEAPVIPLFLGVPPRPARLLPLFATQPRTAIALAKFFLTTMAPVEKAFRRGEDETAMRMFGQGVLGKSAYDKVTEPRKAQIRDNLAPFRAFILGAGLPPLRDDEVRRVRVPALLVTGEHSPTVLLRLTDRLEELLPNVERAEVSEASHLMHEDNPTATNAAIIAFLNRHGGHP